MHKNSLNNYSNKELMIIKSNHCKMKENQKRTINQWGLGGKSIKELWEKILNDIQNVQGTEILYIYFSKHQIKKNHGL